MPLAFLTFQLLAPNGYQRRQTVKAQKGHDTAAFPRCGAFAIPTNAPRRWRCATCFETHCSTTKCSPYPTDGQVGRGGFPTVVAVPLRRPSTAAGAPSDQAVIAPVRVAVRRPGSRLAARSGNGSGRSPASKAPLGEATERSVTRVKPAASLDIEGEPSRAVHGEGHGSGEDPESAAARDSPA